MEKKSSKGLIVVIIILSLLVLVLGGYIVYDKFFSYETEDSVETEKEVQESKENLDEIATTLLNKVNNYKLDLLDVYGNNIIVSSVPTRVQLDTMYFYLVRKNNNDVENLNMTKDVVDNYFKDVYGITPSEYPNIVCKLDNVIEYIYDNSKQAYVFNNDFVDHAHGGYGNNSIAQIVTGIKKENNNYVLEVAKLYAGSMLEMTAGHYYSDGTCNNVLTEFDQFFGEDTTGEYDYNSAINYFKNNKEKYNNVKPQYRYTFKKENGNYYIVNYEIIK